MTSQIQSRGNQQQLGENKKMHDCSGDMSQCGTFRPSLDLRKIDNTTMMARLELPGMEKGDLSIHLRDNNLVVSGEKKSDFQESRDGFYRYESSFGSFQRVILVGTKVREHDVKANMKNGVLELRFPAAVMTQEEQQRLNGGQELQQNSRSIHID